MIQNFLIQMGKCYLNNSVILLKFSTPWHLFSTSAFILMQKVGNFYVYCHQLNLNDLCTLHGLLSQSCIIGPCFPQVFQFFFLGSEIQVTSYLWFLSFSIPPILSESHSLIAAGKCISVKLVYGLTFLVGGIWRYLAACYINIQSKQVENILLDV